MTKATTIALLAALLASSVEATRVRGGVRLLDDEDTGSLLSELWAVKREEATAFGRQLSMHTAVEVVDGDTDEGDSTEQGDEAFEGDNDAVPLPIAQQGEIGICDNPYSYLLEPPVPGVRPGTERPHVVLGMGVSEPPFTTLGQASEGFPLSGFVKAVGMGLMEVCDIDVEFSQASPNTCFTSFGIGDRLVSAQGWHGCANYLPTPGQRLRQAEFTNAIADNRTPSGIITRLVDGEPVISGLSDLQNALIIDVPGVVPNPEALELATNTCTGQPFNLANVTFVVAENTRAQDENDAALLALLEGQADAAWINAVTPESLSCSNVPNGTTPGHDCTLWDGLGSTFAFIHTGIPSIARSGTTLGMSKKGSGLPEILNPCIDAFLQTQSYLDICLEHGLVQECFPNEFFPSIFPGPPRPLETPTDQLETSCADGYCSCPNDSGNDNSDGSAEARTP